jgi:plastocyanin
MKIKPLRWAVLLVALMTTVTLPACAPSPTAPSESAASPTGYRVTIAVVALAPATLEVPVGARVMFLNNDDNFPHHMASACSEIDAVGLLQPRQSGQTAPFANPKTCHYYDRLHPANIFRQGQIIVR